MGDRRDASRPHDLSQRADGPGYALDLRALPCDEAGLRLHSHDELGLEIAMSEQDYTRVLLGDTGVASAVADGVDEAAIAADCREILTPAFDGRKQSIVFDAGVVVVRRAELDDGNEATQ